MHEPGGTQKTQRHVVLGIATRATHMRKRHQTQRHGWPHGAISAWWCVQEASCRCRTWQHAINCIPCRPTMTTTTIPTNMCRATCIASARHPIPVQHIYTNHRTEHTTELLTPPVTAMHKIVCQANCGPATASMWPQPHP